MLACGKENNLLFHYCKKLNNNNTICFGFLFMGNKFFSNRNAEKIFLIKLKNSLDIHSNGISQ